MIVWLTGSTGAGKTWLGDYLRLFHGWLHIDGDRRICLEMFKKEVSKSLYQAFDEYWFDNKEAPLELWLPYYQELCGQIAKHHKQKPEANIVLSFSTYPRVVRDYVRDEVRRLTGKDLVFIMLEMSKAEYAKRQRDKLDEWIKANNMTIEEVWNQNEAFKAHGEYSEENLDKYYQQAKQMRGLEPIAEDEPNSYIIDTNDSHVKVVPDVTCILNLSSVENFDNDLIMKVRSERIEGYKLEREKLEKAELEKA